MFLEGWMDFLILMLFLIFFLNELLFENDKFLFSGWRNWNLKFENVSGLFNVEKNFFGI